MPIDITKNNYITAVGTGDTFDINIESFPANFNNYFTETCRAAEEIYDHKQGKLYLLYSGGMDSEYALSIFLSLGMSVTPVIIKLNPGYNAHDFKYATDFCSAKNLVPLIIDIDLEDFVQSGKILDIAKSMKCNIYHRSTTAYAISQLGGTVILGDGDPYVKNNNGVWDVSIYEHDCAMVNYFKNNGIYGTPHFLYYTPEMLISFLTSQRIKELVNNQHPGKLGSNSSKHAVYNEHSNFNLVTRPKYHGFELIEQQEIFKNPVFEEFDKLPWTGGFHEEYNTFIKRLCVQ